jgi:type I restriction enzyme S subunit
MGMSTDTTPPPPTVPPGYKQTEVGVIPVEWEVQKLEEIAVSSRPICYGIVQTGRAVSDGVRCIRVIDITNGYVNPENLITTSEAISLAYKRTILSEGDIVIALRGKIGEAAVIEEELAGANLTRGVALIAPQDCYDSYYLQQYLSSFHSKKIFEKNLNGSALQEIPISTLKEIPVPLPPPPEQRAIAAALADVDGLITALDRLIAKKRAIKQATMQQLLTGKTRLPGFGGAWEKRHVIEFGEVVTGGTPNTNIDIYWGEEYPWITPTDISTHRDMFTSERRLSWKGLNAIRYLPANSVLVTCIASIGKNAILKLQGGCNQQINAVIPNEHYSHEFLYYLFESSKKYLLAKAGITATSIVSKAAFEELNFLVPPLPEQRAIAAVLSDMDAEIAALEQRRAKTQAIKQGMMQQLLTGRIRLTTEEVNV